MNMEQILKRIDQMDPAELSALVCEALDEANVEYVKGKSDIKFNGLPIDDNMYCVSLEIDVCYSEGKVPEKKYGMPVRLKQYAYKPELNSYSGIKAAVVA